MASLVTKASMTTTIHYKQLESASGLCVLKIQACQLLNILVMLPVGMNLSSRGLIGGSRSV